MCEDDLVKTTRKLMSIFGNYDFNIIRNIYRTANDHFMALKKKKASESEINLAKKAIMGLFNDVLTTSIMDTTKDGLKIIFRYAPENTYSAGDAQKQISKFKMQGITIKYIIIDYLDTLRPTLQPIGSFGFDEYNTLGLITQELRTLSRIYGIPVITASQTSKEGDKLSVSLNNSIIGDSFKKIRYSDFVYMQRIRHDQTIFSENISRHVFRKDSNFDSAENPNVLRLQDELSSFLKPVEMRITKSKEKGRGYGRYTLFCTRNLRLYNYVDEYVADMINFEKSNKLLLSKVKNIINLSEANLTAVKEEPIPIEPEVDNGIWDDPF